jgi:hypothetical protein
MNGQFPFVSTCFFPYPRSFRATREKTIQRKASVSLSEHVSSLVGEKVQSLHGGTNDACVESILACPESPGHWSVFWVDRAQGFDFGSMALRE